MKKVEKNFSAILTLNIELHCEAYCNQHIYSMLGIEEFELSLSSTLKTAIVHIKTTKSLLSI